MVKILNLIFTLIVLTGTQLAFSQKSFRIKPEIIYLDANDEAYQAVGPGDTLLFEAGNRKYLLIKNFKGQAGKPIVMMNTGGEVIIDTDHYFGISIQNCRYFRFTGTGGTPDSTYGFKIKRVSNGGGMGIGELSSDFEIDHVSVENCMIGGIYAKTDPDCSLTSVRNSFTQFNTSIHDNYIANVGDEGLYVGSSKYYGQKVLCDGNELLLLPSLLDGVKIYNNIIKYSGWDGIQVGSASGNCRIYNNTVLYDSQLETESQMSGIIIGGGSKCDCYNNFISQGKGDGIESHGLGGYRIFNNIILDAGRSFKPTDMSKMKHGIYVTDVSVQNDSAFYIEHNDIINPKSEGIRFSSVRSKNNSIASNVIINPGNFDFYENGNTSFKGSDSYIMFQNVSADVILRNNYLARNSSAAGFSTTNIQSAGDLKLVSGSPLINAADPDSKVTFDYSGFARPYGPASDIGAFEYDITGAESIHLRDRQYETFLAENPVKDILRIYFPEDYPDELVLNIYDLNGINIGRYRKPELNAGNHLLQASVSAIRSGIYFYVLSAGKYSGSGKFIKL